MIRKHIIAHGRVQGVGLRFTVTGFAKKYNVTGWVRNLYDGTVDGSPGTRPPCGTLFTGVIL